VSFDEYNIKDVMLYSVDIDWALQELRLFQQMTVMRNNSRPGFSTYRSSTAASDHEVTKVAPVVEQILDRLIPEWHDIALSEANRWSRHREAAIRATTILERQEELREKLGDNAPTLDASRLHPWAWEGARSLWQSCHYREAVTAAARKVNAETQNKLGRRDVSELDLFNQAFSDDEPRVGKPRLRLPEDDGGKSALSVRRGVRCFAEGCFAAIRNPASHDDLEELPEGEALEQLAAFSVLARWVGRAVLSEVQQ